MNIVEASYKVGLTLRKSREGENLLLLYKAAQESISQEAWENFEKVSRKKWGNNYFSFPYGWSIFEANRTANNLPLPLKEDIERVLCSEQIRLLCNESEKFGLSLDKVSRDAFAPTITRTFTGIETPPKLVRALQDLGVSCQKTGLLTFFAQNYKSKDFQEKMNEYENKKRELNATPFSHNIRRLIRGIASEKITVESLYKMEAFSVLLEVLRQVIFEAHLDLILELKSEDIKTLKRRGKNKIQFFSMKLNEHMFNIMNWNGSIIKFSLENSSRFGLVTRRKLSWGNQDSQLKICIWGIIYPNNDTMN